MRNDKLTRVDLLGDIGTFTSEQRAAREQFIAQELDLPSRWLRVDTGDGRDLDDEDCCEIDAEAAGCLATTIYNTLVDSGPADPRFKGQDCWQMTSSFARLIKEGGDAYLWALIRIGLAETADEDLAAFCEARGLFVRRPPSQVAHTTH